METLIVSKQYVRIWITLMKRNFIREFCLQARQATEVISRHKTRIAITNSPFEFKGMCFIQCPGKGYARSLTNNELTENKRQEQRHVLLAGTCLDCFGNCSLRNNHADAFNFTGSSHLKVFECATQGRNQVHHICSLG